MHSPCSRVSHNPRLWNDPVGRLDQARTMETKADWPPSSTTLTAVGVGKEARCSLENSPIRAGENAFVECTRARRACLGSREPRMLQVRLPPHRAGSLWWDSP